MRTVYILGLLLALGILVFSTHFAMNYVPTLSESWHYMRDITVTFPSTHTYPVVVLLPLPSDQNFWSHINKDGSDIRVTVGVGSHEEVLPTMLYEFNPDENKGYVAVLTTIPTTTMHFRLYYGNPDATPPEPFATVSNGKFYAFYVSRFSPSDWNYIRGNADASHECVFTSRALYLVKSGAYGRSCVVRYAKEIPKADGTLRVYFRLNPNGADGLVLWLGRDYTSGFVPAPGEFLGYRDANGEHVTPGYGIEVDIYSNPPEHDPSYDHYALIRDVNDHIVVLRRYNYTSDFISLTISDGTYSVKTDRGYLFRNRPLDFSLPMPLVVSAADGGITDTIYLTKVYFQYTTVSPTSVVYSKEVLPPQVPTVSIDSPSKVVPTRDVSIHVVFTDPNDDMRLARITLDNNTIYSADYPRSPAQFTAVYDLNEGTHTIVAYVVDEENLSAQSTLTFTVDTTPPDLNVSLSTDQNIATVDINATDNLTGVTCGYMLDNNGPFSIPCVGEFNLELNMSVCHVLSVYAMDGAEHYVSRIYRICPPPKTETRTVYIFQSAPSSSQPVVQPEGNVCGTGLDTLRQSISRVPVQQASPLRSVPPYTPLVLIILGVLAYVFLR